MNFEVFIAIQPSFTKKEGGHGIDFLWAFVPEDRIVRDHGNEVYPSACLSYERFSKLGIQVKDSGADPGADVSFNYPNNGSGVQNTNFYHMDRVKSLSMEASGKGLPGKNATFKNRIWFQFNLFTEKYEPVIPKNLRIVRHRRGDRIYTLMHEVIVDGKPVLVPQTVERKKRKPQAKRQINKPRIIENTRKYAVKSFSLFDEE